MSWHRKEIPKLTFRALALRQNESRNCGLCVVYMQKYGIALLLGAWQREKQRNDGFSWHLRGKGRRRLYLSYHGLYPIS